MAGDVTHLGRCLCGSVSYEVRGPLRDVINCHCPRCRRHTGHFMAATAAARSDIALSSDASLQWFHPTDDPEIGYGFCRHCGSSLFWRSTTDADEWSICAGTIDPPTGLATRRALFTGLASDYHRLDPEIEWLESE